MSLDDEYPHPRIISLDNITVDPLYAGLFEHRSGCASTRGRDCTCETLAQWDGDAPALAGAGTLVIPDALMADFDPSTMQVSGAQPMAEVISASEYARRGNQTNDIGSGRVGAGIPIKTIGSGQLRAELHTAREKIRFWRRGFWLLFLLIAADSAATIGRFLGWW